MALTLGQGPKQEAGQELGQRPTDQSAYESELAVTASSYSRILTHASGIEPQFAVEIILLLAVTTYLAAWTLSRTFFRTAASRAPRRELTSLRELKPEANQVFSNARLRKLDQQGLSFASTLLNGKLSNSSGVGAISSSELTVNADSISRHVSELQLLRKCKLALQSHLARFFEVGRLISSPKRSLIGQRVARFA